MLTIGLCLLALVSLTLGLRFGSSEWVVAAAVLTAFALVTLVRRAGSRLRAASEDAAASDPDAVWVVDGRPRYHARPCVLVKEWEPEPIPHTQAVEDGFVPCPVCGPDDE